MTLLMRRNRSLWAPLECCSCTDCDMHDARGEANVNLSADSGYCRPLRNNLLMDEDYISCIAPPPRSPCTGASAGQAGSGPNPAVVAATPRQRDLRDQLTLPTMPQYPDPPRRSAHPVPSPDAACVVPDEDQRQRLLDLYRGFALDLHRGVCFTQLKPTQEHAAMHCQLMDDFATLKVDARDGHFVEFPLESVRKVGRVMKMSDHLYTSMPGVAAGREANLEHVVIVEFNRRRLAFVFKELEESQEFAICMELLVKSAQQKQERSRFSCSTTTAVP
mmetsp:Transcript_100891/g.285953  ORF Transcript_100891/g.285953 Transcript_100891/m.285953 type:complete len:276 (-) Transcript_100891:137-964(-)